MVFTMEEHCGQPRFTIGKPFPNSRVYIIGPSTMVPAALCSPGELCVAGAQVGRGYLNRPEKSSQSFIRSRQRGSVCTSSPLPTR